MAHIRPQKSRIQPAFNLLFIQKLNVFFLNLLFIWTIIYVKHNLPCLLQFLDFFLSIVALNGNKVIHFKIPRFLIFFPSLTSIMSFVVFFVFFNISFVVLLLFFFEIQAVVVVVVVAVRDYSFICRPSKLWQMSKHTTRWI